MKSIGQIFHEAYLKTYDRDRQDWKYVLDVRQAGIEAGAKAVLLHALDLIAAAGVTSADAARELRTGKPLEEVCEAKSPCGKQIRSGEYLSICQKPPAHDVAKPPEEGSAADLYRRAVERENHDIAMLVLGSPNAAAKADREIARLENESDDGEEPPCSGSPEALARIGKGHPSECEGPHKPGDRFCDKCLGF